MEAAALPLGEAALSVGRLVASGFGFTWTPGEAVPAITTPTGQYAFTWVEHHTPFVSGDAFQPIGVPALTGVDAGDKE